MKKKDLIDKLLFQQSGWEETFKHFARKGMEKSSKKELLRWVDHNELDLTEKNDDN